MVVRWGATLNKEGNNCVQQRRFTVKCSECIHDEVCIYKDSRRRLEEKAFIAEITCKHAMSWDMRSFMKSEVNPDQAKFRYTYPDI
jgi:hypothetical protein